MSSERLVHEFFAALDKLPLAFTKTFVDEEDEERFQNDKYYVIDNLHDKFENALRDRPQDALNIMAETYPDMGKTPTKWVTWLEDLYKCDTVAQAERKGPKGWIPPAPKLDWDRYKKWLREIRQKEAREAYGPARRKAIAESRQLMQRIRAIWEQRRRVTRANAAADRRAVASLAARERERQQQQQQRDAATRAAAAEERDRDPYRRTAAGLVEKDSTAADHRRMRQISDFCNHVIQNKLSHDEILNEIRNFKTRRHLDESVDWPEIKEELESRRYTGHHTRTEKFKKGVGKARDAIRKWWTGNGGKRSRKKRGRGKRRSRRSRRKRRRRRTRRRRKRRRRRKTHRN